MSLTISVLLDGVAVEVELAHGDYVRAERDGYRFTANDEPSADANANLTFHALCRAKRRGLIDIDVPATFDDFLDVFSYSKQIDEDEGSEGKGSSQETVTG